MEDWSAGMSQFRSSVAYELRKPLLQRRRSLLITPGLYRGKTLIRIHPGLGGSIQHQ